MTTSSLLLFVTVLLVGCTLVTALSPNELNFLSQLYFDHTALLSTLSPAWSSNTSEACGLVGRDAWEGLICSSGGEELRGLVLPGINFNATLPASISGLTNLRSLDLSSCHLTGALPSMFSLSQLSYMNLSNNDLDLCQSSPTLLPSAISPGLCDLTNQNLSNCQGTCCGCAEDWTSARCQTAILSCASEQCTGTPPPEVASTCEFGSWTIAGSYVGPLTVNGSVVIQGDYTLNPTQLLVYWGVSSSLQVNGRVSIHEALFLYMDPETTRSIKSATRRDPHTKVVRYLSTYAWNGFLKANLGGTNPLGFTMYARTEKSCRSAVAALSGKPTSWDASLFIKDTCSLWWILLLAIGLPVIIPIVITTVLLLID